MSGGFVENVFDQAAQEAANEIERAEAENRKLFEPLSRDPWKHRSSGMRCKTCIYFVPKETPNRDPGNRPDDSTLGRCRRHAPTMSGYPAVFGADWCGDHKLDETLL